MSDIFSSKPYEDARNAYQKDLEQLAAIGDRLLASAQAVRKESITNTAKHEKLKPIRAQMAKISQTHEEAKLKYHTTIDAIDARIVENYRGLCAYGVAMGKGGAALRYLLEECKAYDDAKGDFKRRKALFAQVTDVIPSVVDAIEGKESSSPDTSILTEYEAITDPEYSTAFYKQHKDVINAQLQARLDSKNNIN